MARRRQGSPRRSRRHRRASTTSRPIAGPEAFRDVEELNYVRSQAATLLLIGAHMRGDTAAVQARAEASGRAPRPVARRRPGEASVGSSGRLALHLLRLWYSTRESTRHLERVERRHARAGLRLLDARVGKMKPSPRGSHDEAKEQPFAMAPIILRLERHTVIPVRGRELASKRVQEDRVFARLLREDPLGQTR
jgi:hypothetical protein